MRVVVNICKQCGSKFLKNGNNQKFCSKLCEGRSRKAYWKLWNFNNYLKQILHQVKCRAKRDGLEFDLEETDIVIPEICPVLNIPMKRNTGSGWHDDSPSIDRIDNNRGYTKDNIRVISNRANRLKCDATLEELELILADARSLKS